jgi:hypothetical protein
VRPSRSEEGGPRLDVTKHLAAEKRLERYFLRLRKNPRYTYPNLEQNIELSKRKLRERGEGRGAT